MDMRVLLCLKKKSTFPNILGVSIVDTKLVSHLILKNEVI